MKKLYPILILVLLFAVKSEKFEFDSKYITTYKEYSDYFNAQVNELAGKHSGKLFTFSEDMLRSISVESFFNSVIIIDTTVVARYRHENNYYIKTASRSANNLLCEFKCSKDVYEETGKNSGSHYLLACKINSVKSQPRIIELDSIDNKSIFVNNGQNVALYGECIEAVGLPASLIFANE